MKIKYKKDKNTGESKMNFSLFSFRQWFLVFFIFTVVITISFNLFFNHDLAAAFQTTDYRGVLVERAGKNFLNVIALSFIVSVLYNILKLSTIRVPVKKILDAIYKITRGDFSTRIVHKRPLGVTNEFDVIIEGFNKMAEELGSIETLKTDFIANVSHEIKTPLAVIQNYSTMLQNPELSEEERIEYARVLTNASANLSELVTSILRLNKLENQQIFPQEEEYNLGEQICECMLKYENEWENKNLNIETDIDNEIVINADKNLVSTVWTNLISNAVKFTDEGDTIFVTAKEDGEYAVVTVADTGCGMPPETVKHIFEKFYQGDTSRATKGNGLGLALVKRVLDIVGGEIYVESEPDYGTMFTVKLPLNNIF